MTNQLMRWSTEGPESVVYERTSTDETAYFSSRAWYKVESVYHSLREREEVYDDAEGLICPRESDWQQQLTRLLRSMYQWCLHEQFKILSGQPTLKNFYHLQHQKREMKHVCELVGDSDSRLIVIDPNIIK